MFTSIGCSSSNQKQQETTIIEDDNESTIVETIVEEDNKQEVIEDIPINNNNIEEETLVPSKYDYWVVFYDQYGNELQRTVEHYGTTPLYKQALPTGFIKWTYKKTGKDVYTFKPITTNTYFVAQCDNAHNKQEENSIQKRDFIKLYVGTSVAGADTDGNMIFRVLSKNRNIYKLLGFNKIEFYEFNSESMTDFGGIPAMAYEGGRIDTKLSNWYTTLDSNVQNAIKSTKLKQHLVEWIEEYEQGAVQFHSNYYYKIDKYIELTNNKYVFAPDIDDVLDYLDGTFSAEGIKDMLNINGSSTTIWTRCAGYDYIHPCVNNVAVRLSNNSYSELSVIATGGDPSADIVPCFNIDLSANNLVYEKYNID